MHKNHCWMSDSLKYLNELLMFSSFDLFFCGIGENAFHILIATCILNS